MMEVFRSQIPFMCFGKAISLKGSHVSSSLASQGQWSPMLVSPQTWHEVTFSIWAIDSASERKVFSFGRDGKFTPHLLIKGVKNLVGGTLMGNSY
jgi:hypothetical protein